MINRIDTAALRARAAKRRRKWLLAVLAACVLLAWAAMMGVMALSGAASYYRTPGEIGYEDRDGAVRLRLGGYVEKGSVVYGEGARVHFRVTDCQASEPVVFNGVLPDLFREEQGVVAEGRFVNGAFVADTVLARHDERYMPKEVAEKIEHTVCEGAQGQQ
ncbi:MAG: Cytochrome c-type biogenesis protein CcmE [Candidatus Tokpelaia hoelldobleri]|uniref:Cytochrome c-type biogenesis protein CcmE n=1 Tax=Candidatus Tokpelaia hoelldobleri TaxID=1902579 RepID=A0A1U9JVX9_9HYPH|nr:MAG: Cytochrome c-type biogenesis protein CcmE [Candidatus Tokpelaia hoelldoblerii]